MVDIPFLLKTLINKFNSLLTMPFIYSHWTNLCGWVARTRPVKVILSGCHQELHFLTPTGILETQMAQLDRIVLCWAIMVQTSGLMIYAMN